MSDLFSSSSASGKRSSSATASADNYTAKDIEVLEGLEPVRRRPGMYIGGTDEAAMHHLVNEVFDNAMDEAVAGHASRIELELHEDNVIVIHDNGRGIPVDPHPKFKKKSALEVIMCTLHAGGKFSDKVYYTSGGLHGVGVSVVNALSDAMQVDVIRNKTHYQQQYSRGIPMSKLVRLGNVTNRRGTTITFHPDPEIFGEKAKFRPEILYKFARSKAYLYRGVEIRWHCAAALLDKTPDIPEKDVFHFPGGLSDFMQVILEGRKTVTESVFSGEAKLAEAAGSVEWAITWPEDEEARFRSYCNTVYTPEGGTHETGFKSAITKGIKAYGELIKQKKTAAITGDDIFGSAVVLLSVFIRDPQFQGQTKEKLVSTAAARLVENAVRDHFDNWLSANTESGKALLEHIITRAEERRRRKQEREVNRKNVTQRLRLPGKLADCTRHMAKGSELFLVEGDSAGGSAKQARNRETQAILPLRGKILNVASASADKIHANQEISDILLALGCGSGKNYNEENLRYDKVIIMTDADVDGAHIASLLMTFFYQELPQLIYGGHLYLAQPPLFRITQGTNSYYAIDDAEKERIVAKLEKESRKKIEVGRFKGLGEMTAQQLKETTMLPGKRRLYRVQIDAGETEETKNRVEQLMGRKPELRFRFIQEQTELKGEELKEKLDL